MAVMVAACLPEHFDQVAGICHQVTWIPQPTLLPGLSVADAQAIGGQVAYVLAIAFVFRLLRKFIETA